MGLSAGGPGSAPGRGPAATRGEERSVSRPAGPAAVGRGPQYLGRGGGGGQSPSFSGGSQFPPGEEEAKGGRDGRSGRYGAGEESKRLRPRSAVTQRRGC